MFFYLFILVMTSTCSRLSKLLMFNFIAVQGAVSYGKKDPSNKQLQSQSTLKSFFFFPVTICWQFGLSSPYQRLET